MVGRFRIPLLLALLALLCAQGWNRWNLQAMEASPVAHASVRTGGSVMTADDASYLKPVERFLGTRPDLLHGPLANRPDLRSPGYGLFYLMPRLFLPAQSAISVLIWLQCLLYAVAVALLWDTLLHTSMKPWARWSIALAFAMLPTFQGFLFYTLTEGVTPALSLILLCCALRAEGGQRTWLLAGLLIWSLLMFTRPVLVWTGLALLPGLLRHGWVKATWIAALAALPLFGWWVVNSARAGKPISIHPVYLVDAPGLFRPMHSAFWELAKSWGARGSDFHSAMAPAFEASLVGDTAKSYADAFIHLAPHNMLAAAQERNIRSAFAQWQRFNCMELAPALRSPQGTLTSSTESEVRVIATLGNVTAHWRAEHPFHYHIRVPMQVLWEMVAHSNLNLWLFQHTLRGKPWVETLRWVSAALHAILLVAACVAFLFRVPLPVRLISGGAASYMLFLAYVQRGVEERYTLPVLFIGVACFAFLISLKGMQVNGHPVRGADRSIR